MIWSTRARWCVSALVLGACRAVQINTMVFNNSSDRSATIQFSEPVVVEQLNLCKKVSGDNVVPVAALMDRITDPPNYPEKLRNLSRSDDKDPTYRGEATVSSLTVDLKGIDFQENVLYCFKALLYGTGETVYSESFVYDDGRLQYARDCDNGHWYSNIWVWCCVVLIVVLVLLVLRLLFY
ncbi:hypothetical protein PAPHI01_2301 [Pancytospora philotis]|nr:hypothetical protein PAPHI01_2301 [Pancytospora philotis]